MVGIIWVVVDLGLGIGTFFFFFLVDDMTILGIWLVFQFTKKLYMFVYPIHLTKCFGNQLHQYRLTT